MAPVMWVLKVTDNDISLLPQIFLELWALCFQLFWKIQTKSELKSLPPKTIDYGNKVFGNIKSIKVRLTIIKRQNLWYKSQNL